MKSKYHPQRNTRRIPLAASLLVTTLFSLTFSANAVGGTWDGEGGTNGWGNSAHWVGNTTPTFDANTNIIFYQAGTTNLTTYLGAARIVGALTFNDNADSDVSINLQSFSNVAVTLTLGSGSVAPTINVNSGAAGNFAITNTGSVAGSVILANNLTVNHNGSGILSITRPISGATFGITKNGTGTQILNGTNTYTGATTISDGTLALGATGSIANSTGVNLTTASAKFNVTTANFTLGATQTLGGIGTVENTGRTFTANGILAPGNSPGALTVDGGTMALGVGGDYNFEVLDASGAAGTGYDTTNLINGATLDLTSLTAGSYTINLISLFSTGPDVAGNASNFNNTLDYSWTLFSTSSSLLSTFDPNDFTINAAGFTNALGGGTFSVGLADGDTNLVLNFTAIPEPSSALLGGLGLLALLRRRRN